MYMLSTKEELYLYLEKISRGYALKDLKYFTANHISESLNISRNLASQYLNELVKEERAINCLLYTSDAAVLFISSIRKMLNVRPRLPWKPAYSPVWTIFSGNAEAMKIKEIFRKLSVIT